MKIVVAPDSFKGSLSAIEVAKAIQRGVQRASRDISVRLVPMADGGEGTIEALLTSFGGSLIKTKVTGPLGELIEAEFAILNDEETIVLEMSTASGLTLVQPDQRNPLKTTSFGTGELIKAALDMGRNKLIIGIGGSATNDGGAGMATALGVRFLDQAGNDLAPGGGNLDKLVAIDWEGLEPRLKQTEIRVACDVTNPLCGTCGASAVYGPQKGATPEMVSRLDRNLAHYADILAKSVGKDVRDIPGSGAAGGLGAALLAFLDAKLQPGIDIISEAINLDEEIRDADLVITGEGRTDAQTEYGKVPLGIAQRAKKFGVPVVCLSGGLTYEAESLYDYGITSLFSIVQGPISLADAMRDAEPLLERAAERIVRLFIAGPTASANRYKSDGTVA